MTLINYIKNSTFPLKKFDIMPMNINERRYTILNPLKLKYFKSQGEIKMTITQRILLVFSFLSVALISLIIIAITVITGFQSRFHYIQTNTTSSIIDLGVLINESNELLMDTFKYQTRTDTSRKSGLEKKINERINRLILLNQNYLENDISSDEDKRLALLGLEHLDKIKTKFTAYFERSNNDLDNAQATQTIQDFDVNKLTDVMINRYQEQLQLNIDIGKDLNNQNNEIYKRTIWSIILGSIFVIAIVGVFAANTILNVRKSLTAIRNVMETANSNLDLTLRADESRKDEIGLTASAFNKLIEKIALSLTSVRMSSLSVSTASEQISAGNEDLSSRTEEQAASLEQTAASMSQLSETVRQTAENTQAASQLSNNARLLSDDNSAKVSTMLSTMGAIKDSADKITNIISLIEGIAFQTNILALNAAVEAARAGEQGRGFAVVAGEVRNLAQRSSSSAREIKDLIDSSMGLVETGANQAQDVGQNMGVMKDTIDQVADLVNEIAAAAKEQMQGIDQVHLAVNQMDDVTQQNASLVQEASAASHSLMEQAQNLNQMVEGFIIRTSEEKAIPVDSYLTKSREKANIEADDKNHLASTL